MVKNHAFLSFFFFFFWNVLDDVLIAENVFKIIKYVIYKQTKNKINLLINYNDTICSIQ